MAKFSGKIGYVTTVETAPGVWVEKVEEVYARGDIKRCARRFDGSETLNDDLVLSNTISVMLPRILKDDFAAIRYVTWAGAKWKVSYAELVYPRLELTIGKVYNEPPA